MIFSIFYEQIYKKIANSTWHRYHNYLLKRIADHRYSKIGLLSKIVILIQLISLEKNKHNLGVLQSQPSGMSILYASVGMFFNLNHLGSVYMVSDKSLGISYRLEKDVIEWTKKLFHVNDDTVEGYVTSGGTESNLFMMWSLREFLKSTKKRKTCVLVTSFTHYSILKAAKMLNIEIAYIPLDKCTWSMDVTFLPNAIFAMQKRGFKNILVVATLGYSSIGTSDSIIAINSILSDITKRNKEILCAGWVDAAAQGIPFSLHHDHANFLSLDNIYGISVDFHKTGNAPIPSGVIIYRNVLRKAIQQPIEYLKEYDVTVSGSRPGFSSLSIWSSIYGKSLVSMKRNSLKAEQIKYQFIKKFKESFPKATIIHSEYSYTCAIVVNKYFNKLSEVVEQKYNLNFCTVPLQSGSMLNHYKIHITPLTRETVLQQFLSDVINDQNNHQKGRSLEC